MSADPAALLEAAHAIVADQIARLRALAEGARQRGAQLAIELRQAERALDEVATQHRFAATQGLPTAAALAKREQSLRTTHDALAHEYQALQRALKQLDQLARQIDMSSSTLSGSGEGDSADPWAQALRSQVIMGREQERVRLAREVHDGPAQVLANALMGLEHCRNLLAEQRGERLGEMLDRMRDAVREGLDEVRQFITDLRPGRLEELGLVPALHEHIRRYRDSYNPQVTFEADALPRLAPEAEIVLYRLVQEALQNAHKHARGAAVRVVLALRQGQISLSIRDDGPGFEPREVIRRTGRASWGLLSMRERAELIGARFVVTSRPGHGTEVAVTLTLQPPSAGQNMA